MPKDVYIYVRVYVPMYLQIILYLDCHRVPVEGHFLSEVCSVNIKLHMLDP